MSEALDILNNLSDEEVVAYSADPETEEHIVVGRNRFITVPESLKRIAVQKDHNVETVTFDCPRYWDEYDISTMDICINYRRSDGEDGSYHAKNVAVDGADDSIIHFTWTIEQHVTMVAGALSILICAKQYNTDGTEEVHWNSEINEDMYISKGMSCGDMIDTQYPDAYGMIISRLTALESGGVGGGAGITTGTITIPTELWSDVSDIIASLTIDYLTDECAVFFTPSTESDKELVRNADIFVSVDGTTVTFTAENVPAGLISLDYAIIRKATDDSEMEAWVFTLDDGSTVSKAVAVK